MVASLLLEFPSAVEAVRCALAVQEGMAERNESIAQDRQIRFRVGINVGDVVAEGTVRGVMGMNLDVTERIQLEEQLRQAQKMEAVGQLAGGVAHDFNNLLAVIVGNADLLASELGADNKFLQSILRASERGSELTQRLLAFSRREQLHVQSVDINVFVEGMGEFLRRTLGGTISIDISTTPDIHPALVDPGQLENAILNLAINARDAMPGGGRLLIRASNATLDDTVASSWMEVKTGEYVVFEVSDDGVGMSHETLDHALEPFFTTKDVGQGSGLGLSMVYGFVKQSGGELIVHSEEGFGTTVKMFLPRALEASSEDAVHKAPSIPDGRGEQVLVVEDDPDVREFAASMLLDLGYRVTAVENASEGMERLSSETNIALLLSDVVLPGGKSGPELARDAKQRFPDLKVVFMSGYAESEVEKIGRLMDGTTLLDKPFRRSDLANAIRTTLDA